MTKPLDKYDLHEWSIDSKRCWSLAVSEIRRWGLITGLYEPVSGERDYRWA